MARNSGRSSPVLAEAILRLMADVPMFDARQRPADIVAAAGQWLAERVGDGARYLKSRREILLKKTSGQIHGVTLQSSSWSRAGQGTWVSPRVWATDPRVRAWQDERTLVGLFSKGGYIFSTLTINLGFPPSVELFGPRRGSEPHPPMSLPEFVTALKQDILPHLALLDAAPALAIEQLPDRWLSSSPETLFWWTAAYGDVDATRTLLTRYFEVKPGSREPFETGRRLAGKGDPAPTPITNTMVAWGWSAVAAGSLEAGEPV